jgi:hypothetical protein
MKKLLIILILLLASCTKEKPLEQVILLDNLGLNTYYIMRSDGLIKFSINGELYSVDKQNYVLYELKDGYPYVKTTDFINFKIFVR